MQTGNSQIHISVWLESPMSTTTSDEGARDHGGGTSVTGGSADRAHMAARLWDKAWKHWRARLAGWPPKEEEDGLVLCRVILFNDFLIPS